MELKHLNELLNLDNLGGQFSILQKKLEDGDVLCLTPGKGERIHIASALNKQVIYVTKDSYSAQQTYQQIKGYLKDRVCLFQPNDDLLMYRKSFQTNIPCERVKALYNFLEKKCDVLVTSPLTLVQFVPSKKQIVGFVREIKVNDEIDIYELIDFLSKIGYSRQEICQEKNTFAVHGDIVDIFLADQSMPIRISFFGDTIENIKYFDVESMLSTGAKDEIVLYPNNDMLIENSDKENAIQIAKKDINKMQIDAATRCEQIISELAISQSVSQQDQWLIPYVSKSLDTIFSYVRSGAIMVLDEPDSIKGILSNYRKENESRVAELAKKGEVTLKHVGAILSSSELESNLDKVTKLAFSNLTSSSTLLKPKNIVKLDSKKLNNYVLHYDVLKEDLLLFLRSNYIVVVCQTSKDRAESLTKNLISEDVPCVCIDEDIPKKPGIYIVQESILDGFVYKDEKIVVIGSDNLVRKSSSSQFRKDKKNVFVMPKVGDFVVHETYGIGKCLGPKRMRLGEVEQDYVVIEYLNDGILYLPVSQMDKISRYSGSEIIPKLSSLQGKDFEKLKAKVKKSIKEMAVNLLDLYASRQNKKGFQYSEDDELMREFEDNFEYEETPDQIDAIKDIKEDMEKGVIMDRLLCGDVGYGKTEVALRAIFKTILNGKQAAFLCPTTILAQQHYETAKERFKGFGIGVELISRLKTNAEIKESLERIKEGKSQVVIATHRLLSKDVQFADLGLLVLDEEQRFGVEHKEKLKVLKNNLNVLTLSATPIPRTLNMSLIGVRDISVLETPPINRLPIQTSVVELTPALLEDAIKRELGRGGQVFILFNDIQKIERFASDVQALVPEAKVIFAHGKMANIELEDKITKFYSKEANVLVCTTIIENGIDIPDANTLIVCHANKLGLSQLYQLRGRVGRSNKIAYAYFTVDPNEVLTDTALKRLNAIMDYTELGSGFKIAMRDLEIRGAGNILGREQHGHIEKVGYDMYCKLLQEAVNEIKGLSLHETTCQMEINIDAYLSMDYISDDNARMKVFRDILDVHTKEDVDILVERMKSSFGDVPQGAINLIKIGFARNLAQSINIEKVVVNAKNSYLVFENIGFLKDEKIMNAIQDLGKKATITSDVKPRVVFDFGCIDNSHKFDKVCKFLINAAY